MSSTSFIKLIEIRFQLFINEMKIYYSQYGSNNEMLNTFMEKHFTMRYNADKLGVINIADKYYDIVYELLEKIEEE